MVLQTPAALAIELVREAETIGKSRASDCRHLRLNLSFIVSPWRAVAHTPGVRSSSFAHPAILCHVAIGILAVLHRSGAALSRAKVKAVC